VAEKLRASGHDVLGSARSDETAQKLRAMNVEPVRADVEDTDSLASAARKAGAAIYAVQYTGDFADVEDKALRALVDALAASKKTLIYTSGAWVYGNTGDRIADETDPLNPTPLAVKHRRLERVVFDATARDVRSIVLRLGTVYGRGRGIPAMWVQSARETGAARFVGDGTSRWPLVYVEDLARAYVLALEKANTGDLFNVTDGTSFTVRDMAEAASYGAGKNGAVTPWPLDEARKALGPFADALALDQQVSAQRIRESLGWTTQAATIIDDLRSGSYATATVS
jgi:nucleoside-diphosphate-sugar epimerase